ncbi:hypothetical protein HY990_05900 [Candidatus Micrarchaeota archaeon]|nr:hypothetical protein [Candidatus Micrarchaeota archaeon]
MKLTRLVFIVFLLLGILSATMTPTEISAARVLINSNQTCDKLSPDQLEQIGDYYMEQMHPGSAHDAMERMLGGEGSVNLRLTHIQMAEVLYCGQTNGTVTYGGMMGLMPVASRFGNYGLVGGMMSYGGMMNYGNMMGFGYGDSWSWMIGMLFWILMFVVLILAIVWFYKNLNGSRSSISALELLDQRYVKGEISKKQYDEMKKDLGSR